MRLWLFLGAASGLLAVMVGAFAAHGLKARLSDEALAWIETGVRYQMYHALALLAVAWLATRAEATGTVVAAGLCFLAGTILFSGLLYAMALSGQRWLGAIVPLGGIGFILGWILMAVTALRLKA